ncbi:hypothetical protein [Dysgonomonas sp. ZJ709]|uniref:hypothetical protein n=1 Tax=Dysgonomonas sp. ZJ709 TaxID=2709797 RepID=UPI0013EBB57D|nr:hypothetical protein [Dysgonomonas sp. ZJ709]
MKKILFFMLVLFITVGASANDSTGKTEVASDQFAAYHSVIIHLQTPTEWNFGSTIRYDNGFGYTTQDLNVMSNIISVKKGSIITIDLLLMGGGYVHASDNETRYEAMPITGSYTYVISEDREIVIRVDTAD